jgi:hypothetical protein
MWLGVPSLQGWLAGSAVPCFASDSRRFGDCTCCRIPGISFDVGFEIGMQALPWQSQATERDMYEFGRLKASRRPGLSAARPGVEWTILKHIHELC